MITRFFYHKTIHNYKQLTFILVQHDFAFFERLDPGTSGTLNALHETQVLASNNIINNKHYNYTNTNILCLPFKYFALQGLICIYVLTITTNIIEKVVVVVVLVVVNYV